MCSWEIVLLIGMDIQFQGTSDITVSILGYLCCLDMFMSVVRLSQMEKPTPRLVFWVNSKFNVVCLIFLRHQKQHLKPYLELWVRIGLFLHTHTPVKRGFVLVFVPFWAYLRPEQTNSLLKQFVTYLGQNVSDWNQDHLQVSRRICEQFLLSPYTTGTF